MSKKYILIVAVSLLLVGAIAVCGIMIGKNKKIVKDAEDASKRIEAPFCMLVLGHDEASGLCDVMMLVSVDRENGTAAIMQIPRDTYALYGDGSHRKLNAAARILGEEELCEFLSEALGVKIDGYVSLELDAFRKIVDRVGGVEVTLKKAIYYEDPSQGLYIYLPKGRQMLDGEKAEMLVRYRSGYSGGDLDRLDAQKVFLAALFSSIKKNVNILNAYGVASDILPNLKTNIGAPTLVSLGLEALRLEGAEITVMTLPGEGAVSELSGASFYVMSAPIADKGLRRYFGKTAEGIDLNSAFLHADYKSFKEIYEKDGELSVSSIDELG